MDVETIIKTVLGFYPDTEAICLFGSYLTPDEHEESDVDIALLFPRGKARLMGSLSLSECRYKLEDVLNRTVDLINIRMANTVFQYEIIQEGRIIYKQNDYAVDNFEMVVISSHQKLNNEYFDFHMIMARHNLTKALR